MTETPIMSGGATATDDGVGMLSGPPDGDDFEGSGANRRRLLILGTVAGIIILAAAAYLLLHKSSSSTSATFVPRGVVKSAPAKAKTTTKTPVKKVVTTKLPKVLKHPEIRDPFLPLVTAVVDTGTSAPASSTTVSAPTTAPTPTTGTQPVVTPTTGTTTTTGTGKTAGGPLWIQLISANSTTAHFKVGYAHHKFRNFTVQAPTASSDQATIFAKIFALIAVQSGEATVQIGDGAPFILTLGVSHVS
jgi:hypothetical protein